VLQNATASLSLFNKKNREDFLLLLVVEVFSGVVEAEVSELVVEFESAFTDVV